MPLFKKLLGETLHGISARQLPPPGAGVQWLRTRDTRAAFLLLQNPGGVCSQQHRGKRGHSTALCAACDRNAEATCVGQGVLPAVLRLGRPQVCSARYLGWQLGRRRNTERRGNKGNRKQGTSLREKNTQPQCCSWHQRSLRAALKPEPCYAVPSLVPAAACSALWCSISTVGPEGSATRPGLERNRGTMGAFHRAVRTSRGSPWSGLGAQCMVGPHSPPLCTLCSESDSLHRRAPCALELSSLPLPQFPPLFTLHGKVMPRQ